VGRTGARRKLEGGKLSSKKVKRARERAGRGITQGGEEPGDDERQKRGTGSSSEKEGVY